MLGQLDFPMKLQNNKNSADNDQAKVKKIIEQLQI
jgi:hypothetical protein